MGSPQPRNGSLVLLVVVMVACLATIAWVLPRQSNPAPSPSPTLTPTLVCSAEDDIDAHRDEQGNLVFTCP